MFFPRRQGGGKSLGGLFGGESLHYLYKPRTESASRGHVLHTPAQGSTASACRIGLWRYSQRVSDSGFLEPSGFLFFSEYVAGFFFPFNERTCILLKTKSMKFFFK